MIENIHPREDLIGLARRKRRCDIQETIDPRDLDQRIQEGWNLIRKNRRSLVVAKAKRPTVLFEDRVWMLLYRMGFPYLSGEGGATLIINPDSPQQVSNQIDVLAMDAEIALAVECKTAVTPKKNLTFRKT